MLFAMYISLLEASRSRFIYLFSHSEAPTNPGALWSFLIVCVDVPVENAVTVVAR